MGALAISLMLAPPAAKASSLFAGAAFATSLLTGPNGTAIITGAFLLISVILQARIGQHTKNTKNLPQRLDDIDARAREHANRASNHFDLLAKQTEREIALLGAIERLVDRLDDQAIAGRRSKRKRPE